MRLDDTLEIKSFGAFEIKSEDSGEVAAVIATLGVIDKDGDVFLPGSFPDDATVHLSAYRHDIITEGAPPVGIGKAFVKGDKAVFQGRFFLSTTRGRDAFHTVKELGADNEWSFSFKKSTTKTTPLTEEWRTKGARRLISGMLPCEASPVFEAAGHGTGTLYTKEKEEEPAPPDPAIEAKRIEDEKAAARQAEVNAYIDKRFKRGAR